MCICRLVAMVLLAALLSGCVSVHREAERIHWSRHPMQDNRMSDRARDEYVPCGVWRIRGAHNTVYLAGTSHLIGTNQIPLPSPYYAAYADSRLLYVEADTLSPFTMLRLLPKMLTWVKAHRADLICPKGQTLSNFLSAETLGKLGARYGRDLRREAMTPLYLLFTSEVRGLSSEGNNGGVEDVFTVAARRDHKRIRELDDKDIGDTALLVLDEMLDRWKRDMAANGVDAVIQKEILEADESDDGVWRRGDLVAVVRLQEEMKADAPATFEKLLPERNRKWMTKLLPLLQQEKRNAMVLVGVAHLGGPEGLVTLLRAAGFAVEQLYGVDPVDRKPSDVRQP